MDAHSAAPVGTSPWRFSLKHLLVVLGLASLVLAPTHYFGGIYLFSIGFSIALVFSCAIAYRTTAVGALAAAAAGMFFGFFFAIISVTFAAHAFFNLLACIGLSSIQVRTKSFAIGLCVTMLAVYSFAICSGITEMRELAALKASYPFEPLTERLAFEDESQSARPTQTQPIGLTPAIATKLDEQDERLRPRHFGRAVALQQLHENTATQFARAAGFGFMRMPSVRAQYVRLDPRTPLKLPAPVSVASLNPTNALLEPLHVSAVYNFVEPNRMAYARNRDEVSGFESHGLSTLERYDCCNTSHQPDWQITRLELVSLMRHTEPRVYVAASLPEMDKLADVPNRPLNKFEQSALPQLAVQQDVVVNQLPDRIEMLGALRAGETCLECHHGDRGKLLGAFSYELVPIQITKTSAAARASAN
jgi:hypothetical protein